MWFKELMAAALALIGGAACGSALCAFNIALGIVAKLRRRTGARTGSYWYGISFAAGAVAASFTWLYKPGMDAAWLSWPIGFFIGAFIGVFILCLAEVMSILPLIYKRVPSRGAFAALVVLFGVGKVAGALCEFMLDIFA